ncbi:MAG: 2OG-Fe dioxygenase family protein [Chloroflexota bacterium]
MIPITTHRPIKQEIANTGYSRVFANNIPLTTKLKSAWETLLADYQSLPPDNHLPDNGLYRYRRYDKFAFHPATGKLQVLPHEDYFQSTDINHVTGGIVRKFAPLTPETIANPFLHALIRFDFAQFPLADPAYADDMWQVDVHQIHVIADVGSEAHPTPEGVHRDGASFVTVHLAVRENADGGIVSIYDDDKQHLTSFQLENILDSYLFNDSILWHGVKPIRSADNEQPAQRGILTFDFHHKPQLEMPSNDK